MEPTTNSTKFNDEDFEKLAQTSLNIERNPLTFLRKNGVEGLKVIKGLILTVILFAFVNFILACYAIYKYFASESETIQITHLFLAIIVCIIFVGIAYYKSYRNAINSAIKIAYEKFNFLIKKACNLIIEKVSSIFHSKKEDLKSKDLKTLINLQEVYQKVFSKLPKFIVKGITFLLNRIPILDLVLDFKNDIESGNNTLASDKLFTKIDTQIKETIISETSKSWVYWMLPLNVIIVLIIIYLKFN